MTRRRKMTPDPISILSIETVNAAERAELGNEQIAVRVERDAMRREHEPRPPLRGWNLVGADSLLRVRPDSSDDGTGLVEDGHTPAQLADDRVVAVDDDR